MAPSNVYTRGNKYPAAPAQQLSRAPTVFPTRTRLQPTAPQTAPVSSIILPGTFYDRESVPIVVDIEADYQFDEDGDTDSNLAEIASQLPATTFWAFAREFLSKLPALFLSGPRGEGK